LIKDRIKKLKGTYSGGDELQKITYALISKFRWDYQTLMKQPIPFVNLLLTGMQKEADEMEKAKKKK